jgi:uncharacterized protein YecE (DUF72 family)
MSKIYVGCSGWTFPGWRGDFYPKGLSQKKELEFASRKLTSIEINGTFYSMQKPHTFQKWYDETPENFIFAVKGPEYITHRQRLKDIGTPLSNFLASGLLCLKEKLGPILWQFPPNMILKDDRFEVFMKMLPHDAKEAAKLAKKHSDWLEGRNFTKVTENFRIRHAFEFRHPSFMNQDFVKLMRSHGVAVVFAHSGAEKSPYFEDVTADFIYGRMHGQEEKFKKGYTKETLSWFAKRVESWMSGKQPKDAMCVVDKGPATKKRDAFIYFDTEEKIYAPHDALNFTKLLKLR